MSHRNSMPPATPAESESSFFASPGSAVATPAVRNQQYHTASSSAAMSVAPTPTPMHTAARPNQHRGGVGVGAPHHQHNAPPSAFHGGAASATSTPFVGSHLSFTPALTSNAGGGSKRLSAMHSAMHTPASVSSHLQSQQAYAAHAHRQLAVTQLAAAANHPNSKFSTTPSVAVPLAFGTPAAHGGSTNQLFFASANRPNVNHATSSSSAAAATSAFPHLPSLGSHSSLPSSLASSGPSLPANTIRINTTPLLSLIRSSLERGQGLTAIFYADKYVTLEPCVRSYFTLAETYARSKQSARAVAMLQKYQLLKLPERREVEEELEGEEENASAHTEAADSDLLIRMRALYLGIQCLLDSKQYDLALSCCLSQDNLDPLQQQQDDQEEEDDETSHLLHVLDNASKVQPQNNNTAAISIKEIIGNAEYNLIRTLIWFHKRQKRMQQRQQQRQSSTSSDSSSFSADDLSLASSFSYLRGHLYELQTSKYQAILWYKLSLYFDFRNYDSFVRLTEKRLMSYQEERVWFRWMMENLFVGDAQSGNDYEWLKLLWWNRVDTERIDDEFEGSNENETNNQRGLRGDGLPAKSVQQDEDPLAASQVDANSSNSTNGGALSILLTRSASSNPQQLMTGVNRTDSSSTTGSSPNLLTSLSYRTRLLSHTYGLGTNLDLLSSLIHYKYSRGYYREAYDMCRKVLEMDSYSLGILPVFLCCCVELHQTSELFQYSHKLVSAYPTLSLSWYSVGCYYYLLKKFDLARRFFYKSTRYDLYSVQAWLGFGHTFSETDESDQALLSYRTVHHLSSEACEPLIYIGMEYSKIHNYILAQEYLLKAKDKNPLHPLIYNELGCLAYKQHQYPEAITYFLHCLSLIKQDVLEEYESTLYNLAHSYRKLEKYNEAITTYNRCLSVSAQRKSSILTSLGFTYHLRGDLNDAIEYYHKSLGLNMRDTFTGEMLDRALKEVFEEGMTF